MKAWLDDLPRPDFLPAIWRRWQVRRKREACRSVALPNGGLARPQRIYVDISTLARCDAGTGIQRLVKAELVRFMAEPGAADRIWPVAATRHRAYAATGWPLATSGTHGDAIVPKAGDHFLGLDLCAHIVPRRLDDMIAWRRNGVRFSFVIYDMLPLLHPEWFSGKLVAAFRRWIRAVAILADDVHCISSDVQQHFHRWMEEKYAITRSDIPSRVMPVSVDDWATGLWTAVGASAPSPVGAQPYCLAVGTVEPRKGYADLLDAFELLWRSGEQTALVIAGRPGWKTQALQKRLRGHAEKGRRLFWFEGPDDEVLGRLYLHCLAVMQPSLGEGLGLPLLEAAEAGKPIFARDLPVYRNIGLTSGMAHFFPRYALPDELSRCLSDFLAALAVAGDCLASGASKDAV